MAQTQKYPLLNYPERLRADYLAAMAAMARSDGKVTKDEFQRLERYCEAAELHADSLRAVTNTMLGQTSKATLDGFLAELKTSDLRFTLLADCLFIAYADAVYSDDERHQMNSFANELGITPSQQQVIEAYVTRVRAACIKSVSSDVARHLGEELATSIKAAGIPLEAIALAGVFAVDPEKISDESTEILKSIGVGLGMLTVGPLVMLGLLSYKGVKWLWGGRKDD